MAAFQTVGPRFNIIQRWFVIMGQTPSAMNTNTTQNSAAGFKVGIL